jgi:2-keto-3-deoxy-L-rhamnonate aldolase RhmA
MAKKDIKQSMANGLNSLLQPTTEKAPKAKTTPAPAANLVPAGAKKNKRVGAKPQTAPHTESVKRGLQADYTRATVIVKVETIDKLKEIAWMQHTSLKEVLNNVLADYVAKFEKQNGEVIVKY